MFRDPRAAKRATGILASSSPLMTAAQKAMAQGQPVKAQTGASVNTRRRTLLEDLAALPSDVRAGIAQMMSGVSPQNRRAIQYPLEYFGMPVPDSAPGVPVGTVVSDLNRLLYGTDTSQSPVQSALRTADRAVTDALTATVREPLPGVNQENIEAAGRGIVSAFTPRPVAVSASPEEQQAMGEAEAARFAERQRIMELNDRAAAAAAPGADTGAGEQLATTRQNPNYTPTAGASGDTGELSSEDALLIAAQGSGSSAATEAAKDLLTETQEAGGKVSAPTVTSKNVTLPEGFNTTSAPGTGTETTTGQTKPEDALPDSLKPTPESAADSTKKEAKENDALLNISDTKPDGKPLTYKERVQARFEVLKDLIGEDKAKDIRTDKNYNLMMLGLRIAAGQDPNALTNIAAGAGQQLQEFGEASGEASQRRADKIEGLVLLAASDVSEEMKAEAAREFAASESEKTRLFQAGEAQKGRDFQFDMNMFDKNFASLESSLNRQHDRAMRVLGEGYADRRAKNAADLQIAIRNANSQDQINLAVANYEFQADMAANGRVFDLQKLILTQQFAAEQGADDREFRAKLAMIPGDTQRLYEKYLTPEQVARVLLTDKSKANRDKERGDFIEKFTTTQSSMDLVRDALASKGVGEAEMPNAIAEFAAGLYDEHIWPTS
mgnify:FL=1